MFNISFKYVYVPIKLVINNPPILALKKTSHSPFAPGEIFTGCTNGRDPLDIDQHWLCRWGQCGTLW